MSKYTIEVYSLLKDKNFKMFDFDYDFYTDNLDIKQSFEAKFIDTYLFNEIGQETVVRFKHFLKRRLNNIMPYYKQLYETELRTKEIDFMLNKDLTETFERLVEGENISNVNANSTNSSNDKVKESYLDQGLANIDLEDKLTGVTSNNTTIESNSISSSTDKNNNKETTKLISQGNIGVTSSAELLEKWRKILINIDMLIIEECADLFMQVY